MLHTQYALLLAVVTLLYGCGLGKSETNYSALDKTISSTYRQNSITLIAKEQNLRLEGVRYALGDLPVQDSLTLMVEYLSLPETHGQFLSLPVLKGEQYNIHLPGEARAWIDAGTQLYTSTSLGTKYHILEGKIWLKAGGDSAVIMDVANKFTARVGPNSSLNVDNYYNDSNMIISMIEGPGIVTINEEPTYLQPKTEIWYNRLTGKIETKPITFDLTDWTGGGLRHFNLDFIYQIHEVARLYNKELLIGDLSGTHTYALDFNYRTNSIEKVVDYYNSSFGTIKVEVKGNNLIVKKR